MLKLLTWLLLSLFAGQDINFVDLEAEWRAVPLETQVMTMNAINQVGVPYRYATSDPDRGFDCSGLVRYAAATIGIELPHSSGAQFRQLEEVEIPAVGDLIWYPGHVAIYIGQGLQVHAPQPGRSVEIRDLPTRRTLKFARINPGQIISGSS